MREEMQTEIVQRAQGVAAEIRLEDGRVIWSPMGGEVESARADLAGIHARLHSEPFVLVGDAVVRSSDVRYVRVYREGSGEPGMLDALKQRLGGGERVATYDTEQQTTVGMERPVRQGRPDAAPSFADQYIGYGRRPWIETKPFFLTSEFLGAAAMIGAVLIATATSDELSAWRGWLLATIVAAAYIVSRGLAKAGTKEPNPTREPYR